MNALTARAAVFLLASDRKGIQANGSPQHWGAAGRA